MKNLALLLLLLPGIAFAQKTKLDNDTIYKDNVAYGILVKTAAMPVTFSIRTLNNTEIAVAKFDADAKDANGRDYLRVTFLGSGAIGHFPNALQVGKKLAEAVVENDLIKENAVNPEGEKRFLALYPNRTKTQPAVVININNAVDYTTVERNRSGPVVEVGGALSQGGVSIGKCTTTSEMENGKSFNVIKYYLPSGVQCAEARCETIGAKTATVTTMKDNKTHTVTIKNPTTQQKEIAQFLADNFYL